MVELVFPGGKYPITGGTYGSASFFVRAAYDSGEIHAQRRDFGGTSVGQGELLVFTGPDGVPLRVDDSPFHLWQGGPWWHLLVRIAGEDGISEWVSADHCSTWKRATRETLMSAYQPGQRPGRGRGDKADQEADQSE
jgi:hypothetical protein